MSKQTIKGYSYDEKEDEIGRGTFGAIYRARHIQDPNNQVAIKMIDHRKSQVKTMPTKVKEREVEICKNFMDKRHENLVSFIDCEVEPFTTYLIMEFCAGGDFRGYLKDKKTLSESVIRRFFRQIVSGLKFLHDRDFIHRDLKPDNILLSFTGERYPAPENIVLKIADFGLARFLSPEEMANTRYGTLEYMAPEIRALEPYKREADLWSIGIMIHECLAGCLYHMNPELPSKASREVRGLLQKLLAKKPRDRSSCEQILAHEFMHEHKSGKNSRGLVCDFTDSSDTLIQPRGLANLGNTCYFNSVLQPLCHTHALFKELGKNHTGNGLAKSFFELFLSMQIDQLSPFDPKELRDKFTKKVPLFKKKRQHDSHECLRHFLDEIRKEERAEYNSNPGHSLTTVDKIFGGHLVTVNICKECNKHYHLFEPCLDLSLSVFFEAENETNENKTHRCHSAQDIRREDDKTTDNTRTDNCEIQCVQETVEKAEQRDKKKDISYQQSIKKLTKRLSVPSSTNFPTRSVLRKSVGQYFSSLLHVTLDKCLQHFSRVEEIHEEYICEDCMRDAMAKGEVDGENLKLTCATKQTLIFNPPAVLTIHFKRFALLPGRCRKRSDVVKYPEYLDIAPYCSSQCLRNDPPRSSIWYSLYAVVVHSGSLENGHYLAYVKVRAKQENINKLENYLQKDYFNHNVTPDELIDMMMDIEVRRDAKYLKGHASNWYLINDEAVNKVNLDEVLGQEAYLLFYERVDAIETMSTSESTDSTDSVDRRTSFNVNKIEHETETVPNALLEHGQAETNFSSSQKVTRQTEAESNFASDQTVKGQTENESYTALEKVKTETKLNVSSGKVQTIIKNNFSSGQPSNDQTETGRNDSSENNQTKVRREISIAEQNWKNPHHHGLPHHFEETSRPRGLRNLGNTCYFNSVLQSLCHTHILSNELGKVSIENGLGWSLYESSLLMQIDKISPFDPKELRDKFVSKVPRFNNHRQHDSHECLRRILDEIRKEEMAEYNPNQGHSLTTVDKIFGGHLVTVYICKECNKHYHLFEPCLDLSLPVSFEAENETNENKTHRCHSVQDMRREDDKATDNTRTDNYEIEHIQETVENAEQRGTKKDISYQQSIKKLTKRLSVPSDTNFSPLSAVRKSLGKYVSSLLRVTLENCLQHFSRVEEIHEEYLCEDCMRDATAKGEVDGENLKLTCATKQTLIFNPPAVLTIHFKRFELLPGRCRKRSDMVKYPEYLNVAPYCSSQCLRNDPPRSSIWYSLYAVVVHSGSLEFSSCKVYVKVRERQENIKRLENYLQKEYFNHNITSDDMMGMIKDITVRTDSKFLKSGATNWYLINDGAVSKVNLGEVL